MCTMSTETKNIFSAITKMQAELTNASKEKQGHGYKYADLAQCIEVAKEPLAKNGLAVVQLMGISANNETTLITMLTHESGEYIRSEFVMERAVLQGGAGKNPAQNMGASITYMRRYAFAAIIGMTQEDDDAVNNGKNNQRNKEKSSFDFVSIAKDVDSVSTIDELEKIYFSKKELCEKNGALKELNNCVSAKKHKLQFVPMTDQQRKAIMVYYGDSTPRDMRIEHMVGFLNRSIGSFKEISKDEASKFIDTIIQGGKNVE